MRKLFTFLFVLLPLLIMAQTNPSTDENYILQKVYQIPLTQTQVETLPNNTTSNNKKIETILYYDGLGRPKQNLALRAGGNGEDIAVPVEYDAFGRQPKNYLPYPKAINEGRFISAPFAEQNAYYLLHFPDDSDGNGIINPFSEKSTEKSPLNRPIEQGAPGMDWKVNSTSNMDHTIKYEYLTNTAGDKIKMFGVSFVGGDTEIPQLVFLGFYPSNSLYKNKIKDENWTLGNNNTVEEFINKQNQVILKRTFNEGINHDTYYVYDEFGNITFVNSPKGSPLIVGNQEHVISTDIVESGNNLELYATQTITLKDGFHAKSESDFLAQIVPDQQSIIDELSYSYRYDKRNRVKAKKIPGKGWEFIVYNKLNQPILAQDANLRSRNEWLFTKYDAFGRIVYTGVMNDPYTNEPNEWERLNLIQAEVNAQTQLFEATGNSTLDGINTKWTNNAYPQTNINAILAINYYDHYNWDIAGISNPGTVFGTSVTNKTKSLATGNKVRVLGTNNWMTSVNYYDEKARLIYSGSKNEFLSTLDTFKSRLDFVGKVMEDESVHTKGPSTILINNLYTYNHTGRLKTQSQSINNGTRELIVNNAYDGLGQLVSKKVGGNLAPIPENSVGLQTIDYRYNIRVWLKEINDVANLGTDLFAFEIGYNEGSTPLYNGNISTTQWKTKSLNPTSNPVSNNYNYTYDALNRINTAIDNTDHYGLSLVDYDKNGNILHLDRQGHTDQNATQFGEMDKLTYSFGNGNQLLRVSDSGNKLYGFVDGSNTNDDYGYDSNGNLTVDANKGITSILYNHLNMPTEIKFNNSNTMKINYIYTANGVKLRKVTNNSGNITTMDYAGNFIYENGAIKQFFHSEGYTEPVGGSYKYAFQFKDQLGNIRLSYSDDGNGAISPNEILDEKNYYPGGLQHKGYNSNVHGTYNPYGFNGKEENDEFGLVTLDFGARNYDPALMRWMNIDPLADKMRRHSPYNFAFNNPIIYIDEDGKAPIDWIKNRFGDYLWDNNATSQATTRVGWDYIGKELPEGVHSYDILIEIDGGLYHKNTSNLLASIGNSINSGFGGDDNYFAEYKPYDPVTENMLSEGITEGVLTIAGGYVFKGISSFVARSFTNNVAKNGLGLGTEFIESAIKETSKEGQGLTEVGRALQKHAGREGSFSGIKFSHKTGNEQGLRILNEIMEAGDDLIIEPLENGTKNFFNQSTGQGFNVSREGLFNGFRDIIN